MEADIRTAVLIHSYDPRMKDWEEVVWGDPRQSSLGRAAKGLFEAWQWKAEKIIMAAGAAAGDTSTGSERTLEYVRAHAGDLADLFVVDAESIKVWLTTCVVLDDRPQTTREEISIAAEFAKKYGIERLVLVSSPEHIARCHQEALSLFTTNSKYTHLLRHLYAVASDTTYAGSTVDAVAIIEPPQRADRSYASFNETVKRIIPFFQNPGIAAGLNDALAEVITTWEKKL